MAMLSRFTKFRAWKAALDKIPGPPAYPLPVGSLPFLMKGIKATGIKGQAGFIIALHKVCTEMGPVVRLYLGNTAMIAISDPSLVKDIVVNDPKRYTKGSGYDALRFWLGDSLVLSEGERWREKRSLMVNAFKASTLKHFVPVFHDCADRVAANLDRDIASGKETDMTDLYTRMTLDVIGLSAFGYEFGWCKPEAVEAAGPTGSAATTAAAAAAAAAAGANTSATLTQDLVAVMHGISAFQNTIAGGARLMTIETWMKYTQPGRDLAVAATRLREVTKTLVEQRLQKDGKDSGKEYKDLLSCMLEAINKDDPSTSSELRDEIMLFVFAGHETTATLLSWTTLLFHQHPEVEATVVEELERVLGKKPTQPPTFDQLSELTYMSQVLKESLRLLGPAPAFLRETIDWETIGGYQIPPQTGLLINSYTLHRSPAFWTEPERFDPDRFSAENSKGRHPMAWVPFAAGARNCIGMQFALLEARATLARIMPHYKMRVTNTPQYEDSLLLRPDKVSVQVQYR